MHLSSLIYYEGKPHISTRSLEHDVIWEWEGLVWSDLQGAKLTERPKPMLADVEPLSM